MGAVKVGIAALQYDTREVKSDIEEIRAEIKDIRYRLEALDTAMQNTIVVCQRNRPPFAACGAIEQHLGLNTRSRHEIAPTMATLSPETFRPLFWSYDFSGSILSPSQTIIVQVLNYGTFSQWRWLIESYGRDAVRTSSGKSPPPR